MTMEFDKRPFNPCGPTYTFSVTTTAGSGVQVIPTDNSVDGAQQVRVHNASTSVTVWVAFGSSAAEAQANAVISGAGSPTKAYPLPPGIVEVYSTIRTGPFVSAIAGSAGPSLLYVTPGIGV